MSQIVIHKTGAEKLEFEEIIIPKLHEREILVRNTYCTLCRSDLNTFTGKRTEKSPTILGHEIVGIISAFGGNEQFIDERGVQLKIGDRVTWAIFASDPNGEMAKKGIPQKGSDLFKYGHEQLTNQSTLHGGLAEYTILRKHTPVIKLADHVPDQLAAIINCAVATITGALRLAGDVTNKTVCISGMGMLGTIAASMAKTYGAKTVIGLDVSNVRLEESTLFGTDRIYNVSVDWHDELFQDFRVKNPVDVVLDISGANAAMEQTLKVLAIGGTAVWVGGTFPQADLSINAEYVIRNLLTIRGLHNYNHADLIQAVEFIEQHGTDFPFERLIYNIDGLENVNEAFRYAIQENPFRVGISIKPKNNEHE